MSTGAPTGAFISRAMLLAFMPEAAASRPAPRVILKWAGAGPLVVVRSRLILMPEDDTDEISLEDAFGLMPGTRIAPPTSLSLAEVRRPPVAPRRMVWQLNEHAVEAPRTASGSPEAVVVVWLPLLLPLADDPHFVVTLANRSDDRLHLPPLVYESCLRIDSADHPFADPGHWDGRSMVAAGGSATLRFRFDHFGVEPPDGEAEVALSLGGVLTTPTRITWQQAG